MGIRTDLTSLGAIGLGTAVAVIGTGAVLFAAASQSPDATPERTACVAISIASTPDVPEPEVPTASDAERADAPRPPHARGVRVVVSDRIAVRTECVAERIRAEALEVGEVDPVHVRELVDAALIEAGVRR